MSGRDTDFIHEQRMSLHGRLIARQPTAELERKAAKAKSPGFWTQEDIDLALRRGEEIAKTLKWE